MAEKVWNPEYTDISKVWIYQRDFQHQSLGFCREITTKIDTIKKAGLYRELPTGETRRIPLRLIPYYAWNNRGEPKMTVWMSLC